MIEQLKIGEEKAKTKPSKLNEIKHQNLSKKSLYIIIFALYLTFILLSQIPFIAENFTDLDMDDTYEYSLKFNEDGKQGHYYIERYDTESAGLIDVQYTTISNSLEVDCTNIKVLKIYCREMYEKKSEEIFNTDPNSDSNFYKTYFIERDSFQVHVYTDQMITDMEFRDTPIPYNVSVNGQEWWLTNINYTYKNDGIVLTKVPAGHTDVVIYFQSNNQNAPVARFTASKQVLGVGETLFLNGNQSIDLDGEIISYVWDLGEGSFKGGESIEHKYENEGDYKIILSVTDDDYLIDHSYQTIKIVKRVMSIDLTVDKPIATPGSILNYTLTPRINTSWTEGIKDIVVSNSLPDDLKYVDAIPLPQLTGSTLTWKLGIAFENSELAPITLQTVISEGVENNSNISNFAILDYKGINDQEFPTEHTKSVRTKVKVGSILAPKIKFPVSNIELKEDAPPYSVYLNSYEYDFHDLDKNLKWYITDKNESLYIISGEYSDNDIITITPLPNKFGNSLVTLWLVDSEGFTASQPLWINITPVNDNPIFSSSPNLIIHYDEPYVFDYEPYIFDIDTPKQELKLLASLNDNEDLDESISDEDMFKIDGFKVTYEFSNEYTDEHVFVSLVVFDGYSSDGDTISVNITDDHTPVLKKELPNVWLNEGETKENVFDLDEYFDDPDKDSLFYSFGETHVSVKINANHSVDITSPPDWNGIDKITFRARDPVGAIAEDTISVTVFPLNDPPIISGVPDTFIVHYDADYKFDLTPYINDEDNETEELFLIINDEYIRTDPINNLRIIINYPQTMVGLEVPVRLLVSDGLASSYQDVVIKVTSNWPPEILMELSDVSFYEDEILKNAFNLNYFFADRDSTTLYYSYGQENINITIQSDGVVDFSATEHWHGVEIVTFRATDTTNAFVESVIKVTVIPVNDPPIIKSIPIQRGLMRSLWKIDLTDYIDDIDNEISELNIYIETENLDINVRGRELLIYSVKPLVEDVELTVSDGISNTTELMIIEILEEYEPPQNNSLSIIQLLWLFILVIIIILSLTGFAAWRRYNGNYKIEEIFCIYNNGVLISHLSMKQSKRVTDNDLVSGMLTAVINFTQDAFSDEESSKKDWGINEIQMNEKNILVDKGQYIILATVFSGKSGKKFYSNSRKIVEAFENKYAKVLRSWNGNVSNLSEINNMMKSIVK